ncbi:hypothetical protein [Nocardioides perillae]|uniref:Uncharacterized protein n=1 Tax=Nocardioides perillae TaxID=1119534 RepID=A0A7Y9RQI1_9ACTN|nr:hypothetical protein [Nocardioides perillae]NYG54681.1 hypothetical protein [Nocardioides perillae]
MSGTRHTLRELADHHATLPRWLGPDEHVRRVLPCSSTVSSLVLLTDVAALVLAAAYEVPPTRLWLPIEVEVGRRGLLGRRVRVRDAYGTTCDFSVAQDDLDVLQSWRPRATDLHADRRDDEGEVGHRGESEDPDGDDRSVG